MVTVVAVVKFYEMIKKCGARAAERRERKEHRTALTVPLSYNAYSYSDCAKDGTETI